ncbi:MAG: SDR family oxidoreductase [Opitutaceae bacterium]
MIALTGATGQLGRLVLDQLLQTAPAGSIAALVRQPAKAAALVARGVQIRAADYGDPAALENALIGVEKLLLISSSEVGRRSAQHRNVIDAARRSGVGMLVYTSLLHADTSALDLAPEHRETEATLRASGLPFIILRNGWYTENYTASLSSALTLGALHGSAGEGRIASAARADYAAAAAKALTGAVAPGQTLELAGDHAYTLAELAAELSRQTGKTIPYRNLPEADYRAALLAAGLPEWLAKGLASWDSAAAHGALFDEGRALSRLIGRPTTSLADSVRQALANRG